MKIKDVIEKTTTFFKDKKIPSARLDAEILISYGLHLKRIDLYLKYDQPLKTDELEQLRALIKRRGQGEPVAYIIGEKEFYGEMFKVSPAVLIPRAETEHIVENALQWIQKRSFDKPVRVLDLGCGSGCIGITIAKKRLNTRVTLLDLSSEALQVAEANVREHKLEDRIELVKSDAMDLNWMKSPLRKWDHCEFEIIAANPPYIDSKDPETEKFVKKFEPSMALFAGDQGFSCLKAWSDAYKGSLASEALMLMEIGYQQGTEMYDFYKMLSCFQDVQIIQDLAGHDRIVQGGKLG